MLTYVETDLFESPAQVLVNTVNTVGVMGKGIAKNFKDIYPEMFTQYQKLCEEKSLEVGKLWVYKTEHKWILNFPTKKHWRSPSKVEYVESGLRKFIETYAELGINSISFPLLGCGNGGLDWETVVKPLMEKYLRPLPIDIFIHLPSKKRRAVEHQAVINMKNWLRKSPSLLSYFAVWEDLEEIISNNVHLLSSGGKRFKTEVREDQGEKYLVFQLANEESVRIVTEEQFMDFWNYLRSVGFCLIQELPAGLNEIGALFFTLLIELPYIEVVSMGHHYQEVSDLKYGIRIVPHKIEANSDKVGLTHEVKTGLADYS